VEYATKADLNALRQELKADLAVLRQEIRADMAELKADLARTNQLTLVAMTAIYAGLVAMIKLFA
jgi:hypothetical protein